MPGCRVSRPRENRTKRPVPTARSSYQCSRRRFPLHQRPACCGQTWQQIHCIASRAGARHHPACCTACPLLVQRAHRKGALSRLLHRLHPCYPPQSALACGPQRRARGRPRLPVPVLPSRPLAAALSHRATQPMHQHQRGGRCSAICPRVCLRRQAVPVRPSTAHRLLNTRAGRLAQQGRALSDWSLRPPRLQQRPPALRPQVPQHQRPAALEWPQAGQQVARPRLHLRLPVHICAWRRRCVSRRLCPRLLHQSRRLLWSLLGRRQLTHPPHRTLPRATMGTQQQMTVRTA